MSLYTQASNGNRFATSGIDRQTGVYTHTIPLLSLGSVDPSQSTIRRSINISYSFLAAIDSQYSPYGLGWSLDGLTRYAGEKNLTLSNNKSFSSSFVEDGALTFHDRKTLDFSAVQYEDAYNNMSYKVYNKDGVIELMKQVCSSGSPLHNLDQLIFPNGEVYRFFYSSHIDPITNQSIEILSSIMDQNDNMMLNMTYGTGGYLSEVKVFRGENGTAFSNFSVSSQNGLLNSYTRFAPESNGGLPVYIYYGARQEGSLTYPVTYQVIEQVIFPEGASEQITVSQRSHRYKGNNGEDHTIPRAYQYKIIPGHDHAEILETYHYPGEAETNFPNDKEVNFLGYPNAYGWEENRDSLYAWGTPGAYSYWIEVTTGTTNEKVECSTYNTFHLMQSQLSVQGGCQVETLYHYPCEDTENSNYPMEKQPANALNPTEITKVYSGLDNQGQLTGDSSSFTTTMKYDGYGNQTETCSPSGVVQRAEFYPIAGDGNSCPADPFGSFQRFLKTSSTLSGDGTLKQVQTFTYITLEPLAGADALSAVVKPCKVTLADSSNTYATVDITYLSEPDSYYAHNQYQQVQLTMPTESETDLISTCDFTITTNEDSSRVTTKKTFTGNDGKSYSESKTKTTYTDLVVDMVDRSNVSRTATYSVNGKALSTTYAANTEYSEKETYEYVVYDDASKGSTCTRTQSNGMKTKIYYDGLGQISSAAKNHPDGASTDFYSYTEQDYDEFGNIASTTNRDFDSNGNELFSYTTTYKYDGWGMQCEQETSDGIVEVTGNDPFTVSVSSTTVHRDPTSSTETSLATQTTKFNMFKKPIQKTVQGTNGISYSSSIEYDAFGRQTKNTSAMGRSFSITGYDIFDRITQLKDQVDSTTDISYVAFSPKQLLSSATVSKGSDSASIGVQNYDGIGRVISRSVAGVETTFSYADSSMTLPSSVTTAAGNTIEFDYNVANQSAPVSIKCWRGTKDVAGNLEDESTFKYSTKADTGAPSQLLSASNVASTHSVTYGKTGRMSTQTLALPAGNQSTISYNEVSLLGKPLQSTVSVGGEDTNVVYTYDTYGRLSSKKQGDILVSMDYDIFGRAKTETVTDSAQKVQQKTEITYDEMSREKTRTLTFPETSSENRSMEYSYDNDNRLTNRKVLVNGNLKLDESFINDAKDRLVLYEIASGYDEDFLPQSAGGAMKKQEYTYDICNNFLTVSTTFADNSQDTATWNYENMGDRRPQSISHSSSTLDDVLFEYDEDGNMRTVTSGTSTVTLTHSVAGRLIKYSGSVEQTYAYDAFQKVVSDGAYSKHYFEDKVAFEQPEGSTSGNVLQTICNCGHSVAETDADGSIRYIGSDKSLSCVAFTSSSEMKHTNYSPFGTGSSETRSGFAGERRSRNALVYLPGDGTRAFLPEFGMFSSMDTFSPFLGGGIHPYLYCRGNPVNLIDPSGHFSVGLDLGLNIFSFIVDAIVLGMAIAALPATGGASVAAVLAVAGASFGLVSDTLGIASDSLTIQDEKQGTDRSEAAGNLGLASGVFGVLSMATDLAGGLADVSKMGNVKLSSSSKVEGKNMPDAFENASRYVDGSEAQSRQLTSSPATESKGKSSRRKKKKQPAEGDGMPREYERDMDLMVKESGKSFISTTTGADFDMIDAMRNPMKSTGKRVGAGVWFTGQVAAAGAGYALLANTTWNPFASEDNVPSESETVMLDTAIKTVSMKYPTVCQQST